MDFDFSDEQKAMAAEVRRFLASRAPIAAARRRMDGAPFDRALWQDVAAMGLPGIAISEQFGGGGGGYLELCLVAEEVGRSLAPVPLASSIYLAAEILQVAGTLEQRSTWLPRLASGERIGTFAVIEQGADDFAAFPSARVEHGKLRGAKIAVPDGDIADVAIVNAVAGDGAELFLVDLTADGVSRTPMETIDPARGHVRLEFDDVAVEPLAGGPATPVIEHILDRAAVLTAFEQLGGADHALEMACDYARGRFAFGRPIGSFQAIKHMLADMYIDATLARANCYYAAWALANDAPELPLAASAARLSATTAYRRCARDAIQVHGGIGFTWESDCHLFYRRSHLLAVGLGAPAHWQARLVDHLGRHGIGA